LCFGCTNFGNRCMGVDQITGSIIHKAMSTSAYNQAYSIRTLSPPNLLPIRPHPAAFKFQVPTTFWLVMQSHNRHGPYFNRSLELRLWKSCQNKEKEGARIHGRLLTLTWRTMGDAFPITSTTSWDTRDVPSSNDTTCIEIESVHHVTSGQGNSRKLTEGPVEKENIVDWFSFGQFSLYTTADWQKLQIMSSTEGDFLLLHCQRHPL
jgi:hypothetical protein